MDNSPWLKSKDIVTPGKSPSHSSLSCFGSEDYRRSGRFQTGTVYVSEERDVTFWSPGATQGLCGTHGSLDGEDVRTEDIQSHRGEPVTTGTPTY